MINLNPLYDIQAELDQNITELHPIQEGENRREKRFLALLTEIGELANETRSFKYWSNDQEPRKLILFMEKIHGHAYPKQINPQLEEYVDCLHFILGLGIDIHGLDFCKERLYPYVRNYKFDINRVFNSLFEAVIHYRSAHEFNWYAITVNNFLSLGSELGYTWEEIEAAYMSKNKVNFQRQEQGY